MRNAHRLAALAAAAVLAVLAPPAPAADKPQGKEGTIEGEIVDAACWLKMEAKGEQHKKCAVACSKDGIPAGIVDASGKLYTIMASSPGLAEHQAAQARVSGVIYEASRAVDPKRLEIKKDGKWTEVALPESMM